MLARLASLQRIIIPCSLVLGGCAYQPDSFSYAHEPFNGVRVTVDCLDMAIQHQRDRADASNVVSYAFGNRCDEPVLVDLAAARVVGHATDGTDMALFAFDPFHEIRSMRIDGRAVGHEAIEYPSNRTLERMCIDTAPIAHAVQPVWVCFNDRD
jgi:hypothetical protein